MSDIPSELHREILLRVPAEPLLRFRTVCKAWCHFIDDPSFIRSHVNNQHYSSTTNLLITTKSGESLYSLSLDSIINGEHTIDVTHINTSYCPGSWPELGHLPVSSCNGLILLSTYNEFDRNWALWNPLTGEWRELPKPDSVLEPETVSIGRGLGYDYTADDYKVARICKLIRDGKTLYPTLIYSLKLNSWRVIDQDCPHPPISDYYYFEGVFVNGELFWLSQDMIIALNVGTETYGMLPKLPLLSSESDFNASQMSLDALGGCLVVSQFHSCNNFDGWVMKDNGAEKSWMKLFSFQKLDTIDTMWWGLRPVAYLKSKGQVLLQAYLKRKGQVLLQDDNYFLLLDIENDTAKKVTVDGLPKSFTCQICPGSLLQLHDSGEVSEIVEAIRKATRRKRADKRLKLSVTTTNVLCNDVLNDDH